MKKASVDYSGLRLSNFSEPRYRHLLLLIGWPVFFLAFFLTEKLISPERCYSVHSPLDNIIPFCELFVIPYVLWYAMIIFSLGYFLFYNVDSFKKLQSYIIITQLTAMLIYIVFPTRQDLRPEVFPRENILIDLVALIYRLDTNTGVCPSLHCAIAMAIGSVWLKEKDVAWLFKAFICFLCIMVCVSTMFIKQHSFLDFLAAIPLCMLAEYLLFKRPWDKFMLCEPLRSARIKKKQAKGASENEHFF